MYIRLKIIILERIQNGSHGFLRVCQVFLCLPPPADIRELKHTSAKVTVLILDAGYMHFISVRSPLWHDIQFLSNGWGFFQTSLEDIQHPGILLKDFRNG